MKKSDHMDLNANDVVYNNKSTRARRLTWGEKSHILCP